MSSIGLISLLQVVLDGKSLPKYPVNNGVPQGSILGPKLFLLYTNDLPDDASCNIAIYADDATLYPMPIILLSTLSAIRHLICGNK